MDRATAERARWWSWRRQRLDRTCRGVEDCLRSVVAVSGANPSGPLSLLARVPRLLKGAAVEGVIGTKRAVRIPAMRHATFLVPRETAHLAFAAGRAPGARVKQALRRVGIGEAAYERIKEQMLASAREPARIEDLATAVAGSKDLAPVVRAMCTEGILLAIKSTSIRSNEFTYCAAEDWLGEPLREVPTEEALIWLAGDYLTGYGPVSGEDFAWWTGAPLRDAREALAAHDPVDAGGGWFLHRRDERAFEGMRPMTGRVNLLPKDDCYTMGYAPAGRQRFAPPAVQELMYDGRGTAHPVVLVEGKVQGLWDHRITGDRIRISLQMLDGAGPKLRSALDAEAELVAHFLEAAGGTVSYERLERPRARRAATRTKRRTAPARRGRNPRAGR